MNNINSLFFKAFLGGVLAGISLSEGNYIFMLLGISLLWPAIVPFIPSVEKIIVPLTLFLIKNF